MQLSKMLQNPASIAVTNRDGVGGGLTEALLLKKLSMSVWGGPILNFGLFQVSGSQPVGHSTQFGWATDLCVF